MPLAFSLIDACYQSEQITCGCTHRDQMSQMNKMSEGAAPPLGKHSTCKDPQMSAEFAPVAAFTQNPKVPDSARAMAAVLLIDTLGVAAAAHDLEPARIARDFAVDFHGAGSAEHSATLLFDGRRASVPGAAFAAATQIDNLDAHDGYNPTKGHIGCAVVPALCAFAERHSDLRSRDALDILAMSYEVGARAAIALHRTVSDYHTSGAWNALAVAAIGCRLLGASEIQMREALGIAEYHGPRSQMMREIANPTMLHDGSGMGALTGSMAALLALRGFQGAPALTVEEPRVADIWSTLGDDWTIEKNYIKPYPVCRWAHAPLDALQRLMRNHHLSADQIAALHVNTFRESAALYPGMPETTGQAQYSLAFALAAMMVHGHVGPQQVSGPGLADDKVAKQLGKIHVTEKARHSERFPKHRFADISIELTDGRVLESGDQEARGGPEEPLDRHEIAEKFTLFAAPVLGSTRAQKIWQMTDDMLAPDHMFKDLLSLVLPAPH